jgi:hypothetical protein
MPILLWLIGIPIPIIILLMLFSHSHRVSFTASGPARVSAPMPFRATNPTSS